MAMHVAKQLVESDLDCKVSIDNDFNQTEEEYKEMREHLLKNFPEDFSEKNYSPTRSITVLNVQAKMENREEVFDTMSKSIREAELDKVKLPESEEQIPKKEFKKTRDEVHNDRTNTYTTKNKFVADLQSKTYTTEEIEKKDVKAKESPVVEQPVVQSPVTQGPEIVK